MPVAHLFEKSLRYMIGATRGGPMRAKILMLLLENPKNTHQLAKALDVDYKTVAHHLAVLLRAHWVIKDNNTYGELYRSTFTPEERALFVQFNSHLEKSFNSSRGER